MGYIARGGGILDRTRTGSIAPASTSADDPGPLLDEMPADVIANEIEDPSGAYDFNNEAIPPLGAPPAN